MCSNHNHLMWAVMFPHTVLFACGAYSIHNARRIEHHVHPSRCLWIEVVKRLSVKPSRSGLFRVLKNDNLQLENKNTIYYVFNGFSPLCVYIYIYTYTHTVCIYIYTVCIGTYIYIYIYCVYVYVYIYIYIYIYT